MLSAGQSIGNYRILSKIGTGGMGAVYLAEHPLIGKRVALKVIHRELAGNREVVQRFFQEARAVNTIGNEHIVEIHDFGVSPEGDHFYIMEYLDGRTLSSILSREAAFDVMRALHVGAQIAKALGAAHAAGVVHRDLKPDNVMLTARLGDPDFVKVLDFGLAKMFAEGASAVKTAAGVLLGTPQYMSPEACESKRDVDHRTDVYGLGVLLFQIMTGVLPFDGESMGEVLVKQVMEPPPAPRGFNPAIPPSVEQVLLRCLAKPPEARFQTMSALRDALLDPEAYLRTSPPIAPARSVRPSEARFDARTGGMPAQQSRLADPRAPVAFGDAPAMQPTIVADGVVRRLAIGAPPGLAPPSEPLNHTMRIATPQGYSSRPPRAMWPVVLVFGLLLGIGGGAIALTKCGGGSEAPVADASSEPLDAEAVAQPLDAPAPTPTITTVAPQNVEPKVAPIDAPVADAPREPKLAKVSIESVPPGASVYSAEGALLGKTPLQLERLPSAEPIVFELRLAAYRKRTKALVVSGNTTVRIELERLPASRDPGSARPQPRDPRPRDPPPKDPRPKDPPRSSDSGLMRPE